MSHSGSRIGEGVYGVEVDGTRQTFYVAGTANDRWVWWNGEAFRVTSRAGLRPAPTASEPGDHAGTIARSGRATSDNARGRSDSGGERRRTALRSNEALRETL